MWTASDRAWMSVALQEADAAQASGEVPVGCVIVSAAAGAVGARELVRGRNETVASFNATRHAELVAISALSAEARRQRLRGGASAAAADGEDGGDSGSSAPLAEAAPETSLIVPARSYAELLRLLSDVEDLVEITFTPTKNQLQFKLGDTM